MKMSNNKTTLLQELRKRACSDEPHFQDIPYSNEFKTHFIKAAQDAGCDVKNINEMLAEISPKS